VELKNPLGGCGRVSVCCSALGVFAPFRYPCPLCSCLAPSFYCRPYGEQLGRRVCRYASGTVFPPSGGFLGRFINGSVSGYAHGYPTDAPTQYLRRAHRSTTAPRLLPPPLGTCPSLGLAEEIDWATSLQSLHGLVEHRCPVTIVIPRNPWPTF
jgi:hypothetical protein